MTRRQTVAVIGSRSRRAAISPASVRAASESTRTLSDSPAAIDSAIFPPPDLSAHTKRGLGYLFFLCDGISQKPNAVNLDFDIVARLHPEWRRPHPPDATR